MSCCLHLQDIVPCSKKLFTARERSIGYCFRREHHYLLGRHFTIESNHQPLKFLLGESNRIPHNIMVSSRIQRWALTLSTYKYSMRYKAGRHLCNADALSRLPHPVSISNDNVPKDLVLVLNNLSSTSADAARIKEWTAKDPVMSRVLRYLTTGWPNQTPSKDYQPYFTRRDELSSLDGCILVGSRIIIPPPGKQPILEELHPGTSKMKALARSYLASMRISNER